jgi:hypothetical protein
MALMTRGAAVMIPRWLKLGPWRVLDECPATAHNSLTAARGGRYKHYAPCICPRSVALKSEYRSRESRRDRGNRRAARVSRHILAPAVTLAAAVREPDWTKGVCTTPLGAAIFDDSFEESLAATEIKNRNRAKNVCLTSCPLLDQCAAWITSREKIPGCLGGIWGGMDKFNRAGLEIYRDRAGRIHRKPYARPAKGYSNV